MNSHESLTPRNFFLICILHTKIKFYWKFLSFRLIQFFKSTKKIKAQILINFTLKTLRFNLTKSGAIMLKTVILKLKTKKKI